MIKHLVCLSLVAPESVKLGPNGCPVEFLIWREGEINTSKGDFKFTKESAKAIASQFAESGNLVSIDVDHLSLSETAPPESRKAVGWHGLEVREGAEGLVELWAICAEWTDAVRAGFTMKPPEWRYFSPAFDVNKSGEIVGYLNTALTNNPATYRVTALASRAAADSNTKGNTMEKEEMLAALKKMSADEKKEMMALLAEEGEEKKDEEKKEETSEEKTEEKTSEGSAEEKKDEKKDDDVTTSALAKVVSLSARVKELEADRIAREKKALEEERSTLLASLNADLADVLKSADLETIRKACSKFGTKKARNFAGDITVKTAIGGKTGEVKDKGNQSEEIDESEQLRIRMGLSQRTADVRREGTKIIFPAMTAQEARAALSKKGA